MSETSIDKKNIGLVIRDEELVQSYEGIRVYSSLAARPTAALFGVGICQVGSSLYVSDGSSWSTSGGGSISSVALALPSELFTVSGSPLTTAGTITATLASKNKNEFLMGPQSGTATPSFRRPKAGTAEAPISCSGIVYQTTADANPASTGTTPLALATYTLPANSLTNVGDCVRFEMEFSSAANTNNKAIGVSINGGVADSQVTASSAILCGIIRGKLIKTGASTQKLYTQITFNSFKAPLYQTAALTDTSNITIAAVGYAQTTTTDLTLRSMMVEFLEAA